MRVTPAVLFSPAGDNDGGPIAGQECALGYSLALQRASRTSPRRAPADVVDLLVRSDPRNPRTARWCSWSAMHGTLPREAMRQEDCPRIPRS